MNTPLHRPLVDPRGQLRLASRDPPRRPVLFINPSSGGGKATRAGLAERAGKRGIEAVVLAEDQNLVSAAHEAAVGGADALGMAGGDGSLARWPRRRLPTGFRSSVCRPGRATISRFDVGVDRHDLIGALDRVPRRHRTPHRPRGGKWPRVCQQRLARDLR